jgi:hypothetical protein
MPVRKAGAPPGIDPGLAQPENSTVLGLLHYGLQDHGLPGQRETSSKPGFLGKIAEMVGIKSLP